jgi:purine-binding chemotaxis protein CheW
MPSPVTVRQYVTFSLMGEEYALQIDQVREIIQCERVTSIPSMPPVVRGMMNLRGTVVPVIDLPLKFGLPATPIGPATYLVVVDAAWSGEVARLALLTTELGRVIDVAPGDLKPVPDFGTRIQSEYLRGVGQIDGRFVLFLDTERLLSPAELLRITAIDVSRASADTAMPDPPGGDVGEASDR